MPVAIDASSTQTYSNASQATITTGTITPPAGAQLWVFTGLDNGLGGFGVSVSSSPALTWTEVEETNNVTTGPVAIAWANPGAGWSGTVTANWGSTIQSGIGIYVAVVTGAETTPGGDHGEYDPSTSWSRNNGAGITPCQITATRTGSLALAVTVGTAATASWSPVAPQQSISTNYSPGTWQMVVWHAGGELTQDTTYTLNMNQTHNESGGMASVEIRPPAIVGPPPRFGWAGMSI